MRGVGARNKAQVAPGSPILWMGYHTIPWLCRCISVSMGTIPNVQIPTVDGDHHSARPRALRPLNMWSSGVCRTSGFSSVLQIVPGPGVRFTTGRCPRRCYDSGVHPPVCAMFGRVCPFAPVFCLHLGFWGMSIFVRANGRQNRYMALFC